ncbi:MAG: DUF305 domain-containing protein [Chloroflexota bacterium]
MASVIPPEPPVDEPQSPAPTPSRRIRFVIVIGAMLLFALVVLFMLTNNNPFKVTTTAPAEVSFARDMVVHHAQAVVMALILYDHTQNADLHTIALDIILSQQNQIGQMQGWLNLWNVPMSGPDLPMAWMDEPTDGLMPGMATDEQIAALRVATGKDLDRMFIQLMIPHHLNAIHMAEAIQERTTTPAVLNLARSVIVSQTQEIAALQDILDQLGAS